MRRRRGYLAPRAVAAQVVVEVMASNRFLDAALAEALASAGSMAPEDSALAQELAYGAVRWFHELDAIARTFVSQPFKPKDRDIHALLLVGLYQLRHTHIPVYAAVAETVAAAESLGKSWAKALLNASLRETLRRPRQVAEVIARSPVAAYSHPDWLIRRLQRSYPDDWSRVLTANNQRPPMTLRVSHHRTTRDAYLDRLQSLGIEASPVPGVDSAVQLAHPRPLANVPGFSEGHVSVQDAAAQLAAILLDVAPGARVLDACAAPGGKTCHILERFPWLTELTALDKDAARLDLVRENLTRLGLRAHLCHGDAAAPREWWDGRPYDEILLDAPCSSTGVIRRHPDIKVRRRPADLEKLAETQARLLEALWPLLRPGGKLLYVTCSILPDENQAQVLDFTARHRDSREALLPANRFPMGARARQAAGWQILPGEDNMDGFYYACLQKE